MSILQKIVENKQNKLNSLKSDAGNFKKIFEKKDANIVAEIKLASPKFDYSKQIDLNSLFKFYGENNDIKAISNLIDEDFFAGDIKRGADFKNKYQKPIFFKEFVIDKRQIDGAYYFGYDAILLLERVLNKEQIADFSKYANAKNIFPIVEIDNKKALKDILVLKEKENLDFGIGVNCRNLATMAIDRKNHFTIIDGFEKNLENVLIFAFSGIDDLKQVQEYKGIYNGVLIGTYFMKNFIH